jgi:type II secretory pathway pseudopilin PulG
MRKLKNRSGETLIETLVAILIVSLASVVLVQTVITSAQMSSRSGSADKKFSEALAAAETQSSSTGSGTVTVTKDGAGESFSVPVNIYGGGSGDKTLTSYSAGGASS